MRPSPPPPLQLVDIDNRDKLNSCPCNKIQIDTTNNSTINANTNTDCKPQTLVDKKKTKERDT